VDSDEVLAAQAATGDRVAFEALVLRNRSRVHGLVLLLVGGQSADAEDLTQETFIRAYRAIGQFRQDSSFRTWLHRIAINVIRSYLARRQRASLIALEPGPEAEAAAHEAASSRDDLETVLIRRQAIRRALAMLSSEARLVVTLRDLEGLEYQEIATITRVPIGTVESRLYRASRRLRPLLEPLRASGLLYKS
jgi:RNA polymerase sigma-70 factor (ECF subfamily)